MDKLKLGFIGVGQMAGAILSGALENGVITADQVGIITLEASTMEHYKNRGCTTFTDIPTLVKGCEAVLLAVKPQDFGAITAEIKKGISSETLLISIAAGITAKRLNQDLGGEHKIILAMPNTPLLLGMGATGIAKTGPVTDPEFGWVKSLFGAVGVVEEVAPDQLDLVIVASGSAPAFIYKFAQEIVGFTTQQGLEPQTAMKLFAGTLKGCAAMLTETGKTPEELISMVSSPGGTTIAGLEALEAQGFSGAIWAAGRACVKRSKELAGTEPSGVQPKVRRVEFGSDEYKQSMMLREEILRKPLGRTLTEKELEEDKEMLHYAAFVGDQLVGTGLIDRLDAFSVKVRQVAVSRDNQGSGIGRAIMVKLEEESRAEGYQKIVLNARKTAVTFYESLGYKVRGNEFLEMGIPHFSLFKDIDG